MKILSLVILLLALFLSGVAGLVNEIVWQRALKIFLGGSEALSSMTVILVFLFGMGCGSIVIGRAAGSLKNPLRMLGAIEAALAFFGLVIAWVLAFDISESVYILQRLALSVGIPLRLVYILLALGLLGAPCLLMGMTLPLSSEICQRQFGFCQKRLIPILFSVNTLGAVLGALVSGFFFLPRYGQLTSLYLSAASNMAAAAFLGTLWATPFSKAIPIQRQEGAICVAFQRAASLENITGFFLGFLALAYEIHLFRLMALAHEPRPYTFAQTLCLFLLFWSLGLLAYFLVKQRVGWYLLATAGILSLTPFVFRWDRAGILPTFGIGYYFIPPLLFGMLYGNLITKYVKEWGADVGLFTAFNVLGSCLGILFQTVIGHEMYPGYPAPLFGLGLLGVFCFWQAQASQTCRRLWQISAFVIVFLFGGMATSGVIQPYFLTWDRIKVFPNRDGVLEYVQGNLILDGLWHSRISMNNNHIGSGNWMHAIAPLVAHDGPVQRALVIGLGAGITAWTLAQAQTIEEIDVYEINRALEAFLNEFPKETLRVASNPKIQILWQDGRSGLALNPKKYDLITQQPLYLKQAGSSILLSREYMKLVQSRMNKGAVFCVYSNSEGNEAQALLVRQTVASVFRYQESFLNGYLVVACDTPIKITQETIEQRLALYPEIRRQVARFKTTGGGNGRIKKTLYGTFDATRLAWSGSSYLITDNHPLVEYPDLAQKFTIRSRAQR